MEVLQQIGTWSWFFLWSFLLIAASLFVYLGLGGNFIIIGLALIHALVTGFDPITWKLLAVLLGLALLGQPGDKRLMDQFADAMAKIHDNKDQLAKL